MELLYREIVGPHYVTVAINNVSTLSTIHIGYSEIIISPFVDLHIVVFMHNVCHAITVCTRTWYRVPRVNT